MIKIKSNELIQSSLVLRQYDKNEEEKEKLEYANDAEIQIIFSC